MTLFNNWNYNGEDVTAIQWFPEDSIGFIYEIEFNNGKKYLGRKALYHKKTSPPLKGKKRKRVKYVESNWKKYNGSFKDPELIENLKKGYLVPVKRKIIRICFTPWEMTYYETKLLFDRDCLLSNEYYNNNILGKFYKPK